MKTRIQVWLMIMIIHNAWSQIDDMPARTILEKSEELSMVEGMESIVVLKIIDQQGRERVRKMATATMKDGNTDKSIMKFIEPADVRGTGMLIYDYEERPDDMWIYLPALRKTRRIVSNEKSRRFMGSEFTNADMTVPTYDEFTFNKLGSATVDNTECLKIAMIPRDNEISREYGYAKKIAFIGKKDFLIRQVDYYDEKDRKVKIMRFENYRELGGNGNKYMAEEMRIENLENGRKSVMLMQEIQMNDQLEVEMFTRSYLEK